VSVRHEELVRARKTFELRSDGSGSIRMRRELEQREKQKRIAFLQRYYTQTRMREDS